MLCRQGGSILDDLVTGLARVALKPPVGLFTEGITCRVDRHYGRLSLHRGKSTYPSWAMVMGPEAFSSCPAFTLLMSPTDVAVVHPDAMSVVFAVTFHCIVGEVTFCYLKIWVDDHL